MRPLALLLLALPAPALAQDIDFSGTMRWRYEAIANQPRAGFDRNDDLLNVRTTLMARYETGPIGLTAELWDSRVWLEDPGTPITTAEINTVELVQAYAAVKLPTRGRDKASIRFGRYMLNIGSRRLVAADDYRNTTNGYTGVQADLATAGGFTVKLLYVLPQQRRPDDRASLVREKIAWDHEGFDLVLWGGTAAQAKAIGPLTLEASFYHLGERDTPGRPTRDRSLDTYGGRVLRDPAPDRVDIEIEGFYQSGRASASALAGVARLPVAAWFVHGDVGYTFAGGWRPRVSLEYDRASGDAPGGSYGRFDTLFGMRRADLAPAGLFNAIARTNLSTPGARIEVVPSKRVDAFASYHALYLAERTDAFSASGVRDPHGRSGTFAGHLLDARVRWWVLPARLRFEADGVLMTKGRFRCDAPNAPAGGTTLYGSLNLTASF